MTSLRTPFTSLAVLASLTATAGRADGQVVPLARLGPSGTHDALEVAGAGSPPEVVAANLDFLPLGLAGLPVRDRLRLDLPRPSPAMEALQHVVLPQGGALWRVGLPTGEALLWVDVEGQLALLAPSASLAPRIAVSTDGAWALVATPLSAGGDVLRLSLTAPAPAAASLTAALPPLDVDEASLRVSEAGAFWVAAGTLFRAPAGSPAAAVDLGLPGLPALPDTALSADGRRLAVVAGSADVELADRRIAVVDLDGAATVVTPVAGDWDTPNLDNPLGPFLALNNDGTRVVYRGTVLTQELFLAEVDLPLAPQQISVEPQFPAYIDNVGVLGFTPDGGLRFFAGDVTISGVDQQEMIAAADLYLADLPPGGPHTFVNQSLTSGQVSPPYDQPGQLQFSEAVLDPLGLRYLLVGESAQEDQTLTGVSSLGSPYGTPVVALLDGLDSDPHLVPAGQAVIVVSEVEAPPASEADELQRLDLLPSLHAKPDGTLVPLGILPEPLLADRFCATATLGNVALAVSVQEGLEWPVLLHPVTGIVWLPLAMPMGLPRRLAFDPLGRLILGLGPTGGPYKFLALGSEGGVQWLGLGPTDAFPLCP
jgi:hypothetical protein